VADIQAQAAAPAPAATPDAPSVSVGIEGDAAAFGGVAADGNDGGGGGGGADGRDGGSGPFARGGKLNGPGTGTSDSMLIRASDDEYILPAEVTRKLGKERLDALVYQITGTPANNSAQARRT
jgi:hypothetical protein